MGVFFLQLNIFVARPWVRVYIHCIFLALPRERGLFKYFLLKLSLFIWRKPSKKSDIWETLTLFTCEDSSTKITHFLHFCFALLGTFLLLNPCDKQLQQGGGYFDRERKFVEYCPAK